MLLKKLNLLTKEQKQFKEFLIKNKDVFKKLYEEYIELFNKNVNLKVYKIDKIDKKQFVYLFDTISSKEEKTFVLKEKDTSFNVGLFKNYLTFKTSKAKEPKTFVKIFYSDFS